MADAAQIKEILTVYKQHRWELRRVLLSRPLRARLESEIDQLFGLTEINESESDLDGLWFSRRSRPGQETWELRYLSASPFALVAVIPDGTPEDKLEFTLAEIENRMKERVIKPTQHP